MEKPNKLKSKREYIFPYIEKVIIDNEISLNLESNPPIFPGEDITKVQEFFNNDMFKTTLG